MNEEGIVEVDAAVMRGDDLGFGGIAAVPELGDGVNLALEVLRDGRHCLLAGPGAVAFARARGVGRFGRDAVWTAKAQARWEAARRGADRHGQADTVGAVALDRLGGLAVACSTGGVLLKRPGRVGDSPRPGAGLYAVADRGAACATGTGEFILRKLACAELLQRTAAGTPIERGAWQVCDEVAALDAHATCGLIAIDPHGRIALAHRSDDMSCAWARGDGEVTAMLQVPRP
ncbi:MAG: isoaspartyl peptidase/L-asparaginase [Nannocystaceae bacterium]